MRIKIKRELEHFVVTKRMPKKPDLDFHISQKKKHAFSSKFYEMWYRIKYDINTKMGLRSNA